METKHPGGRPSKYKPEIHFPIVEAMSEMGLTQDQIAERLDVSTRTLIRWMAADEEFCQAVKKAAEMADARVIASLYQKATGYRYKDQVVIKVKVDKDREEIQTVDVIRTVPPDTASMIYWANNRLRDKWRNQWPEPPPQGDVSPLQIIFPDSADLLDPEKQDNLEIGG